MTPRSLVVPPAPPPLWRSTPIIETNPASGPVLPILVACLIAMSIVAAMIGVWRFRRMAGKDALQREEIRLRQWLRDRLGPDAEWISADQIERRVNSSRTIQGKDVATTLRWIEELRAIEKARFGSKTATGRSSTD